MSEIDTSKYVHEKSWGWYQLQPDFWLENFFTEEEVTVLEIGAFDGVSANAMLDVIFVNPKSQIHTIDPFLQDPTTPQVDLETKDRFLENCRRGGHEGRIQLHEGLSVEVLGWMISEKGFLESFDFIFVDGSHLSRDVLTDAVMSWHLLRPGGTLVFDDYEWGLKQPVQRRPKEAIDAFERSFLAELIPVHSGYQKAFRKLGPPEWVLETGTDQEARRRCVIVAEFASGGSLLSQLLEFLGFTIGRPCHEPHYESVALREVLVRHFDQQNLGAPIDRDALGQDIEGCLSRVGGAGSLVCVNHPLLGLCLEEVDTVWNQDVIYIRATQALDDSIEALRRADWFFGNPAETQGLLHAEAERFLSSRSGIVEVDIKALHETPLETLRQLTLDLGIEVGEVQLEAACRLVAPIKHSSWQRRSASVLSRFS